MDEGEQSVWGWEQFFEEMESFIRTAHRGFESSSPQFAEYVVERLRIIIQALSSILTPLEDQEEDELNDLHSSIDEIITCCRSLKPPMCSSDKGLHLFKELFPSPHRLFSFIHKLTTF